MARRSTDTLRDVIRDYRRDQIVAVARQLFNERGSADVSMDEIAAAAGVARSTVYVYFSGRDELLRACLHQLFTQLEADLQEAWACQPGTESRLRAVVQGLLTAVDQSPAFFLLVLATQSSASREGAAVGAELASIGLAVTGVLHEVLRDGMAEGLFRELDLDRAATLVGQQLFGAISVRAGDPAPSSLSEDVADVTDFLLHALSGHNTPGVGAGPHASEEPGVGAPGGPRHNTAG